MRICMVFVQCSCVNLYTNESKKLKNNVCPLLYAVLLDVVWRAQKEEVPGIVEAYDEVTVHDPEVAG